jgi:hypothetical protein
MEKDKHENGKPSGNGHQGHGLSDAFAGSDPETDNELRADFIANRQYGRKYTGTASEPSHA